MRSSFPCSGIWSRQVSCLPRPSHKHRKKFNEFMHALLSFCYQRRSDSSHQLIWWTTCRSRVGGAWREKADSKPNKARAVNSGDPRSKTGRKMASGPVIHAAFDPSRL
ncbi:hypothetical protein DTO217A2_7954 [Paecilomyces variotii]|nr:hypothetical protein DTO217A2_7954 [Paecilomyces variotii]